jgi:hypothetical protein
VRCRRAAPGGALVLYDERATLDAGQRLDPQVRELGEHCAVTLSQPIVAAREDIVVAVLDRRVRCVARDERLQVVRVQCGDDAIDERAHAESVLRRKPPCSS